MNEAKLFRKIKNVQTLRVNGKTFKYVKAKEPSIKFTYWNSDRKLTD